MERRYNHALDLAFEFETVNSADNITASEVLEALERRVEYLKGHKDEILEACSVFDTVELCEEGDAND